MNTTHTISEERLDDLLQRALSAWAGSQPIVGSSSWRGLPAARALCEALAARVLEAEGRLLDLLAHENQHIVAYALLTLDLAGSVRLRKLPAQLLADKRHVTIITGSFAEKLEIGALARMLKKRSAGSAFGRAEPSAPPNDGPAEPLGDSGVGGGPPSVS